MQAVRCLDCGATRWTLSGASLEHLLDEPCEMCGGEVAVERRRPGTRATRLVVERREASLQEPG